MAILVFSGCSALYPVHFGSAQYIYEHVTSDITKFVGTSSGAVVAAFLATGKTPIEGFEICKKLKPFSYIRSNILFCRKLGLFNLNKLECEFDKIYPKYFKDLNIHTDLITSDIINKEQFVCCTENSPDITVSKAIIASLSIPFLFNPIHYKNRMLVDGGLINPFAVDLYGCNDLIGVDVFPDESVYDKSKPDNLLSFSKALIETMLLHIKKEHKEDTCGKIIPIKVKWNPFNFIGLDNESMQTLYDIGYHETRRYFKHY